MSRISVIWIPSPGLSYVCHTYAMPICAPMWAEIRNEDSCILYIRTPLHECFGVVNDATMPILAMHLIDALNCYVYMKKFVQKLAKIENFIDL